MKKLLRTDIILKKKVTVEVYITFIELRFAQIINRVLLGLFEFKLL